MQWEREHGHEPRLDRTGREPGEPRLTVQVRNRDGMTGVVGLQTRPLPEFGLQLLELNRELEHVTITGGK